MLVIVNNILRDNKYGMLMRVSSGAALSILDAGTDLYIISKYYSEGLSGQADALLAMITINMIIQLVLVHVQYKKKSLSARLKEMIITLLFLRPAVDAFRVSTNHEDKETTLIPLYELSYNKVSLWEHKMVSSVLPLTTILFFVNILAGY